MPSRQLRSSRSGFEARILEAEEFVRRCRSARTATTVRPAFTGHQREWAVEAAVLQVVIASERFFESTMALYAIGDRSPSGFRPRRRRRLDCTATEVRDIFRGDQNFVGWNDPKTVIDRAERWFRNGDPFQAPLSGASRILGYLKSMRNEIAHKSDTSQESYLKATRNIYGALPRRVQPGVQLLAPPPAAIAYLFGANLFEAALNSYRSIAVLIVP
jgi:hypothetical protein